MQVAYSHDANACAAFARQAAEDWHAFLVHRADELRPGGQLVVLTMAKTDADDFGYRLVIDALIGALMDLAAEGVVSSKEIEKMVIPTYGRTRAEFVAPFDESGQIAGLALASVEIFLGEDHIHEDYERVGDAGAFGRRWAAALRLSRRWREPSKAAGRRGQSDSTIFSRRGSPRGCQQRRGLISYPSPSFSW